MRQVVGEDEARQRAGVSHSESCLCSRSCGLPRIVSIQNPYSLLNRSFEVGLAEMSIRESVSMLEVRQQLAEIEQRNQVPKALESLYAQQILKQLVFQKEIEYEAKRLGRNRSVVHSSLGLQYVDSASIQHDGEFAPGERAY